VVHTLRHAAYPAYKPSGAEWLGDVPEHWDVKRLKYVASINDEALPETTDPTYEFDYVDIGNVNAIYGIVERERMIFEEAPSRARRVVRKGDTIVSTVRTYLRAVASVREAADDLIVSTGFAVVRPHGIDLAFLSFALRESHFIETVVSKSTGVSYPAINASEVGRICIPVPELEEQQAIARFLDERTQKIDDLIEAKRSLLDLLKEKRQAVITHAVTRGLDLTAKLKPSGVEWLGDVPEHWDVKRLKWDSAVFRGASPRPIDNPIYFDDDGEYAWVRIADVTAAGTYLRETKQRLSDLGASLSVKLAPGDLFLSIAGSVGKPCIAKIKCCIHDGFVYFPRLSCERKFLYYIFASGEPYKGLGKFGTQLNLNTDTVGSISMTFPPLEEQQQIVRSLEEETEKIDDLESVVREAIETLELLRAGIISAAVTGKIDVREEGV
jgi:type I restriction enzyme S subunit